MELYTNDFLQNIHGIKYLMRTLANTLDDHKLIDLEYGLLILSDFYFGNFALFDKHIPKSQYPLFEEKILSHTNGKEVEICCVHENIGFLDFISSLSSLQFKKERGKEYAMKFSFYPFKKENKEVEELKKGDIKGLAKLMLLAKPELNLDRISLHLEKLIELKSIKFYVIKNIENEIVAMRMLLFCEKEKEGYVQGYCNFVLKEYRRSGFASMLLDSSLSDASSLGFHTFGNQATEDGYKFCTRLGMELIGTYHFLKITVL